MAGGLRGLRCLGSHHHGLATGVWWRSRGDQGWMVGQVSSHQGQQGHLVQVDREGQHSGDGVTYIYPDLHTAIQVGFT